MKQTEKENRINELIGSYLPGVQLNAIRSIDGNEVLGAYYALSNENKHWKESQYFFKKKRQFVHFTSLTALESIVQSKNIRLYNLFNLYDPREYTFSSKIFTYNHKNKEDAKQNMFLLSMCNTELLIKGAIEIEFTMWRLYGQNGYGVAIEFSFEHCEQEAWNDFYLSQIYYGANKRNKLAELSSILLSLENEKPKCTIDLGQLMCFHKSNLYKLEKEVRLLYDRRQMKVFRGTEYSKENKTVFPIIRNDITKSLQSNKEINYLELPIFYKNCQLTPSYPTPKISKVHLGYQYYEKQGLAKKLKKMIQDCLGYDVQIQPSRLTKFYNELKDT